MFVKVHNASHGGNWIELVEREGEETQTQDRILLQWVMLVSRIKLGRVDRFGIHFGCKTNRSWYFGCGRWETRKSQACISWSCLRMVTLTEMRKIIRLWREQNICFEVYLCDSWRMVVEIKEINLRHIIAEMPLRHSKENVKLTVTCTYLQLRGNV